AVSVVEVVIHRGDGGGDLCCIGQRLPRARGGGDHLQVRVVLQEPTETHTDSGVVVHHQHADGSTQGLSIVRTTSRAYVERTYGHCGPLVRESIHAEDWRLADRAHMRVRVHLGAGRPP